jgi:hypothetical protein
VVGAVIADRKGGSVLRRPAKVDSCLGDQAHECDPVASLTILSDDIGVANDPSDNCHHVVSAIGSLQFPDTILDGFTITGGNTFDRSENPLRPTSAEEAS